MKSAAASVTRCLTLFLVGILLNGCAVKKPVVNLVPHQPQGEEAKFWHDCQEVTAVNAASETKTFQCAATDGGLYLVKFTKLK